MLRTALFLFVVKTLISALSFARNLVVAWLIPIEDYGIAATFGILVAVVEMASALGLHQQIIQARDGDDPRFQAGLQGFQVLRGVFSGAVLLLLAQPFALFMGVPEVTWAYRLMALVPVLNAFVHFDIHRRTRAMVFWPSLVTPGLSIFLAVATIWPLSLWFGDWRVMLYSLIAQSFLSATISHLVAARPYRLVLDRAIMARGLRFGWPLLINAGLLFMSFNGDRLIVGRELGMAELAIFSMGITLTLTPTLVVTGTVQSFFLPQLAATQENKRLFTGFSMVAMQSILVMSMSFVLFVTLFGKSLVDLLLGEKYALLVPYLAWFSIMQAIRMLKDGPSLISLAVEKTRNAMIANFSRALFIPLCWYVAAVSGDLLLIIWIATLGEAAGYGVALLQLRLQKIVTLKPAILPHVAMACFLLLACGITLFLPPITLVSSHELMAGSLLVVSFALTLWAMRDLRDYVIHRKRATLSGWELSGSQTQICESNDDRARRES